MKILELIKEKYKFEVKKQGDLYVCYCPFHKDENRPNLTIYVKTDSYFCYTCSFGGDAVDFFRRMEGITRQEALRRLYNDLQILIDKLNYVPEPQPYNDIIDIQLSKQFRNFLYKYPDMIQEAFPLMQEVDERLLKSIDQETAIELVNKVNSRLRELTEKRVL